MAAVQALAVVAVTVVLMEGFASTVHRWLMHGPGWRWHRSHHRRDTMSDHRGWQANDVYSMLAVATAVAVFALSGGPRSLVWWMGVGMTVYGALYLLVHDGLTHRRFPLRCNVRRGYLARLVHAHRLHHAVRARDGAVSFGFLWAPKPATLACRLRARRAHTSARLDSLDSR